MEETIIVLGGDGYIGHPLVLRLLNKGYTVVVVDNQIRRHNVAKMYSFSAMPIKPFDTKMIKLQEIYGEKLYAYKFDVSKHFDTLLGVIKTYRPSTIVNLAQQPSAPFSQISVKHTIETLDNNTNGTINCLYAIKNSNPNIHLIQIGSMGEYDQAAGVDIEEGIFDFNHNGKVAKGVIYPRRAPSFYHGSKIASTYYIDLAVRSWGLRVTDIMQGVVYGNWTPEIDELKMQTRLDTDEAFGTFINRIIVQGIMGHPLTVFGEGEHSRGFLSINDSIQCLMLAIENAPNEGSYRTWNQLDERWSMNRLANKVVSVLSDHNIEATIKHIPSPRTECTDCFYFNPKTDKLKEMGFKPTRTIDDEVDYIIRMLKGVDLSELKDVIMPKIKW